MLGDNPAVGTVVQLFDRGGPVPSDPRSLLLGRPAPDAPPDGAAGPAPLAPGAVVCRCNTVTKQTITTSFEAGARDVSAIAAATRATTGCGSCHGAVADILRSLSRMEAP
jgi:assimilatory nitrate reductase electron transfer subunit